MEELEFSYIAGGSINCYDHYGQWRVFAKTNCIHVLGLYIMEGCTLFGDWKNQHNKDVSSTRTDTQISHDVYQ